MNIWAIIPVKPLYDSKSRLSHILSADERAELTKGLLIRTLKKLADVRAINQTLVVSRDPVVLKVVRQNGAHTFNETDNQDLNTALERATHIAIGKGADSVLVLPADLPFISIEDIKMMLGTNSPDAGNRPCNSYHYQARAITICSDHHESGTNALFVNQPSGFTYHYGPNSFKRHLEEADRLGMFHCVIDAPGIKFDLDTEEDWQYYLASQEISRAGLAI